MPAVAFDTLKYADALRGAGVDDKQARAQAEALADVLREGGLATKADLEAVEQRLVARGDIMEQRLGGRIEALRAEVASLKWMFGVIGAGVLLLVLRAFWPLAH